MTKAFDSALRLLTRREHGAVELAHKLQQKGYETQAIQEAVEKCQDLDLQSDNRFVENYIRYRIRQGFGPLKINQELKTKSINTDLIQKEMQQERDNWLGYALEVWQKKSKGQLDLSSNELQKQQRFLLYRGFSTDIISMVLKELK